MNGAMQLVLAAVAIRLSCFNCCLASALICAAERRPARSGALSTALQGQNWNLNYFVYKLSLVYCFIMILRFYCIYIIE